MMGVGDGIVIGFIIILADRRNGNWIATSYPLVGSGGGITMLIIIEGIVFLITIVHNMMIDTIRRPNGT